MGFGHWIKDNRNIHPRQWNSTDPDMGKSASHNLHQNTTKRELCTYFLGRTAWWRHQMEIFSALLAICAGNSPVPGEFPRQRPVTGSFGVCLDLRPNKRLNKLSWGWWFEAPSRPLWRHCNMYTTGFCEPNLYKEYGPTLKLIVCSYLTKSIYYLHLYLLSHEQ